MAESKRWICCQLGAREHYAIPRSLHQFQQLHSLCTDIWVSTASLFRKLPARSFQTLHDRYHPDLGNAKIKHCTTKTILFELRQKAQKLHGWDLILKRNQWFQSRSLSYLKSLNHQQLPSNPILFGYSYAALELFRYAQSQGWKTVLGQIDPGILESKIVQAECDRYPLLGVGWQQAPDLYWQQWQQECHLADVILVNSAWSQQALEKVKIPSSKIKIVPLVYTPPQEASHFERTYPKVFTPVRPLRVLFLGQIILRKGIRAILEASELLVGLPIEFWFVGNSQIQVNLNQYSQIRWFGSVPRSQVAWYYRNADVFLFPTLSDGFGLTQLEAQAWKLPILASPFCGSVVTCDRNGWILSEISGSAIAILIKRIFDQPSLLERWSEFSSLRGFDLVSLGQQLIQFS